MDVLAEQSIFFEIRKNGNEKEDNGTGIIFYYWMQSKFSDVQRVIESANPMKLHTEKETKKTENQYSCSRVNVKFQRMVCPLIEMNDNILRCTFRIAIIFIWNCWHIMTDEKAESLRDTFFNLFSSLKSGKNKALSFPLLMVF